MVKNNASVIFDDPETGEEKSVKIGGLVGHVRDMLLSKRRMQVQATTWDKMDEKEQQAEINSTTDFAYDLVERATGLIFAGDRRTIKVKLDKFTYKDKACKISVDGHVPDMNNLAHSRDIQLVFYDLDQFDQHKDLIQAMPDSEDMFDGDDKGDIIDGEATETAEKPTDEAETTTALEDHYSGKEKAEDVEDLNADPADPPSSVADGEDTAEPQTDNVDPVAQEVLDQEQEAKDAANEAAATEDASEADGDQTEEKPDLTVDDVVQQGSDAYENGLSQDENPYDEGNVEFMDAWDRGYNSTRT